MKKRVLSALCLLVLGISVCSPAFSQIVPLKKRSVALPDATTTAPVTVEKAELPTADRSSNPVIADAGAFADGHNGVLINWATSMEIDIAGFNVYRFDNSGNKQVVNTSLIGGSFLSHDNAKFPGNSGASYNFYDAAGSTDSTYYIESVGFYGSRTSYGPVSPLHLKDISAKLGTDPQLRSAEIAQNSGQLEKNYPGTLTGSTGGTNGSLAQSSESAPDPIRQRWVAAQPGVKFQVRQTGIYHVSKAQLQTAGFDVNSSPALWQLYVNGQEQRMLVEPSGNYVEFYGGGIDNPSSDAQYYYLVVGPQAGLRISSVFRRPFAPGLQGVHFRNITAYQPRTSFVPQIVNGDEDNWWGPVMTQNNTFERHVTIKDINANRQKAFIEISLQGYLNGLHKVQVTLNGIVLGVMEFDGITGYTQTFNVNASNMVDGDNTFLFDCQGGTTDINLFKSIKIDYPRFFRAEQNALTFDTVNLKATKVSGFDTANVRVFDLSLPEEPQLIVNTTTAPGAGGFDVNIPSGRAHKMIAVNENSLLSPVSIKLNTPSQISAGTSNADMLIISHPNFMTGANNWAAYRRNDGLTVDVFNVEDIFDEFDYGLPTPAAIRGFMSYAHTAYPHMRYVLFVGDATYDPRNYLGAGYNDFIPTKFVNTSYGESPSDEWYGDFNNDGVAEYGIGRLPVRDNATIATLQTKVSTFEANITASLHNRGVFFVADEPVGYPFPDVNRELAAQLPPDTPIFYVDLQEDPDINVIRDRVRNGINAGRFLVNYTGHGSTGVWSSKQMFRYLDVPLLNNSNGNLSLFLMLTCLNGFYVDPSNDGLAELLIKSPTGGAATAWTSTGETTPDIQQIMATKFFQVIGAGTYTRLGDATVAAKQNAPSTDVPLTWNILGDPALRIK